MEDGWKIINKYVCETWLEDNINMYRSHDWKIINIYIYMDNGRHGWKIINKYGWGTWLEENK